MKLSIVISVCQAGTMLRRCLDSVLSQSFRDIQVILVDDTSTDGAHTVMEEYCRRDHRVQILTMKKKEKPGQARNRGLGKARGEYVTFIDSNDALAEETLRSVMEVVNVHPDYDFIEYPVSEHYGNIRRQQLLQFPRREYKHAGDYWLEGHAYRHPYVCNKIYRKELLTTLPFSGESDEGDTAWLYRLLGHCHLWATTNVGHYLCYERTDDPTTERDEDALFLLLEDHLKILSETYDAEYYTYVLDMALEVYARTGVVVDVPDKPYNNTLKLRFKRLIGIKGLCRINRLTRHFSHKDER